MIALTLIITIFLFLCWILCWGFLLRFLSYFGKVNKIISPRSLCPHCSCSIAWYDTRPVFFWLALACPSCKKSISILWYQSILPVLLFFLLYLLHPLFLYAPTQYVLPCFILLCTLVITIYYLSKKRGYQ